jgi:hypothetical protein
MTRTLESTAISILEGDTVDTTTFSNTEIMELIEHLQAWLPNYPKGSNKFISFLQQNVSPIHAVYGVFSAVDNGSLELTSRNFQSMLLFEAEFKELIKHLSNPDKKTNFYESMKSKTDISKVELELASPFCIQPEDEIGTGTYDQQVAIEDLFADPEDDTTAAPQTTAAPTVQTTTKSAINTIEIPLKDILDTAAKKVFGVGVKKTVAEKDQEQDDRDAYHVFTQYLYQFTPDEESDLTISVVSQKYWDEHECIDDQHISEYLEAIIPDWSDNWCETMESVFEYTGGSTKADAIAYLKASGFFKEEELFDAEISKAELLLSYLEGQPEEVISKFLKEALTHLNESQIEDLVEKYEEGWHETVE